MPVSTNIASASTILSDSARYIILMLIRNNPDYKEMPGRYPNLVGRLLSPTNIEAQVLNSIVVSADLLKDSTAGVQGGKFGADSSRARDRLLLSYDALHALYDAPLRGPTIVNGRIPHANYGGTFVNSRSCMCGLGSCGICRVYLVEFRDFGIIAQVNSDNC